ncbi:MAG: septum formation initiator family protein [Erysipelotrichaceae bacterium]|nr:septum formation initiator family protein [Erysipelotrichaceae bacterium]
MSQIKKTKKRRKRLNRKTLSKLLSIIMIIAAIAIFSNVGKQLYAVYNLKEQYEIVEKELEALQDENATLVSTKNKLEDPAYVTTYARGEYMFSKGDEKVFYLPSGNTNK